EQRRAVVRPRDERRRRAPQVPFLLEEGEEALPDLGRSAHGAHCRDAPSTPCLGGRLARRVSSRRVPRGACARRAAAAPEAVPLPAATARPALGGGPRRVPRRRVGGSAPVSPLRAHGGRGRAVGAGVLAGARAEGRAEARGAPGSSPAAPPGAAAARA